MILLHAYTNAIAEPINIFFGVYKTDNAPIRLSYHGRIHYNSVVDPCQATIGVGLGLAGFTPGVGVCVCSIMFQYKLECLNSCVYMCYWLTVIPTLKSAFY